MMAQGKFNSRFSKKLSSSISDGSQKNYYSQFPDSNKLKSMLPDSFVINRPMNGVGGDGYWLYENDNSLYAAVFDCMGHGHIASMMTRIYTQALNDVMKEYDNPIPNKILDLLHKQIKKKFGNNEKKLLGTGADIGIVRINKFIGEMEFAGAKMNLLCVPQVGDVQVIKADRMQIGEMFDYEHNYMTEIIDLKKYHANFYLFSDGITDLIGGPNNKKLTLRNLKEILRENRHLKMSNQKEFLEDFIDRWQGAQKALDDTMILGFGIQDDFFSNCA